MEQISEIAQRIAKDLGLTVSEAIGADGKLSEAARRIYQDVAGDSPVFA